MEKQEWAHNRDLENTVYDDEELLKLIRQGEHQTQDFKFRIDSSQKIAKTLSAFANTEGGRLLIGVKDNGRIAGIDPEEEFFMIEGAAERYCRPKAEFSARVFAFEARDLVLEISVENQAGTTIQALEEDGRWRAFVRQADENFAANRVLLHYLKNRHLPKKENWVAYREEEKFLLHFLEENSDISLSKFARISKLPIHRAERILEVFLRWEIIGWKASENGIRFHLL